MKRTIWMLSAVAVLIGNAALAQDSVTGKSEAERNARQRADAYAQALGVDAGVAEKMASVYMEAEEQVAPLRADCAAIQAKVEVSMTPYDAKVEEMLTPEQREKLEQMKKEGTWKPGTAGCSHAESSKAGCAGHEKAAAGCCAGKAGAHGKAPAMKTEATPQPTH